jgi:hypothetical protein
MNRTRAITMLLLALAAPTAWGKSVVLDDVMASCTTSFRMPKDAPGTPITLLLCARAGGRFAGVSVALNGVRVPGPATPFGEREWTPARLPLAASAFKTNEPDNVLTREASPS